MKLASLLTCALALFGTHMTLVRGDSDVDAALKKFCGGIKVTAPATNAVFSDPTNVKVTVTRQPNAEAKVINGVDIYSVGSNGNPKYLGSPWKGSFALNKVATLRVDVTKTKGVKLPSQFMFRVWVHNTAGPDCTLMSKVFKVKSSSHSNAAEEDSIAGMSDEIDRGCFGVDVTSPALGAHIQAGQTFQVDVQRDSASLVDTITSVELFKVDLSTHEPTFVQQSWTGSQTANQGLNIKDTLQSPSTSNSSEYAYFYKIQGTTQHDDSCTFYSHPFYIDSQ